MILYDLAGADERLRFSPYCWRIRLALAHKGLPVETLPWRMTEKEAIVSSGQGLVPVLVDGEHIVHDSWRIACYLEDTYPDRPSIFGGAAGRAHALFIDRWYEHAIRAVVPRMVLLTVHAALHERDRQHFRTTREARFGNRPLEEVAYGIEQGQALLAQALAPVREVLARAPFLGGQDISYADYIVFSGFQQARVLGVPLLPDRDPMQAWVERMLDAHGGCARHTWVLPAAMA